MALTLPLALAACAEAQFAAQTAKAIQQPSAKTQGYYKVGDPYEIKGVWYYPTVDYSYTETGIASWYGPGFHGKLTANGEIYDENDLTAAHRTLPMPSLVRVTNLENGRALVVRVNDRGPFAHGRIIDLSRRSAQLLGIEQRGTAKVKVDILPVESQRLAEAAKQGTLIATAEAQQPQPGPSVAASPVASVRAEALPPPSSTQVARAPNPAPPPAVSRPPASAVAILANSGTQSNTGQLETVPVEQTRIYIQAGAFSDQNNAMRLSNTLRRLAPSQISETRVDGQTFYRVRLGPVASVTDADALLEQVIGSGYPGARVVVD
ncbi:septal ring lytic transglycosylase RlpA family protein [Oceanibaculum indicum]|uniref:septal ring lytic transglycosylase RlpA family protein n=2 Tax=Oceanibaculum indicum TaxID=526216 RepID=UPI002467F1AA|nr:septal ring lytic transglycosylase RlpA family protein [Oceanibaculum indicum]